MFPCDSYWTGWERSNAKAMSAKRFFPFSNVINERGGRDIDFKENQMIKYECLTEAEFVQILLMLVLKHFRFLL